MTLPTDHAHRFALSDEVHARPPEALTTPSRVSYLALVSPWEEREAEWQGICDLARRFGAPAPFPGANHYSGQLGDFRLVWERHGEFARYTFIAAGLGSSEDPFAEPAIALAPASWIASRPGQVIVAAHAAVVTADDGPSDPEIVSTALFRGNALVGGPVSDRAAVAFTDLRIHSDGFGRFLIQDRHLTPLQAGRLMQRLLEIETYRMMALLALPVARDLAPFLSERERELAEITDALVAAGESDEPVLLERLTRLEAEIESREAANLFRFGAALAYHDLVQRRISELREERIQGIQTLREFMERRLVPAMNTCKAVSERQASLSARVARVTQLLSTRVDVTRERQNRAVLESMNRRAKLQLQLQSTVEGLSVAAVTYYVVGLIGYLAKGASTAGLPISPEIAMGASIPVVAGAVWLALRGFRKRVAHGEP
ncbi:DUF3422 family protein [Rhodoplanes roseus]|uniref:Egg lysin n=1 Tax=Rhodoplanes roseus TaxID=29409 RepID=A0A327KH89_9BRAD|nr:DUF3422 domain-containing protein [Rhodoplanes roseus]RAI37501.1 hypothetical protein CH341_29530 [Rhodoplanes roseus]